MRRLIAALSAVPCLLFGGAASGQHCGTTVYDSGGSGGNYSNNQNITTTYCPNNPGDAVTLTFSVFNTQLNGDFLYVHDGNSTAAPLLYILSGNLTGASLPPVIRSTHPSGCITIRFVSNGSTTAAGWVAAITCAPQSTTQCGTTVYDPGGNANYPYLTSDWTRTYCPTVPGEAITLTLSLLNIHTSDILYIHDGNSTADPVLYALSGNVTTGLPFAIRSTAPDGCLTLRLVSTGSSSTVAAGWQGTIGCAPLNTARCGTTVYGPGGPGNYTNNVDWSVTYCPDNAGDAVTLTFSQFNTQLNNDLLEVYNGPNTSSPLLYRLSGTVLPPSITSTDASGCLTLRFISNSSTVNIGWVGAISCAPRSDCGLSFLDIGGNQAYPTNTHDTYTWCPDSPGDAVTLDITVFGVHATDQFMVFNGPDVNAPSLGTYTGTVNPGSFTSSHPDGCLTVRFVSDGASVSTGWVSSVTCAPRQSMCGSTVYDPGGPSGNYPDNNNFVRTYCPDNPGDVVTLDLSVFATQLGNDFLYVYNGSGVDALLLAALNGGGAPISYTSTAPGGCLTIHFVSNASTNNTGWVGTITCTPPSPTPTCGTTVYDPGGPGGHYSNNMDWSATYCPDNPGERVTIAFTQFNTQANNDLLRVYNGTWPGPGAVLSATFSGNALPPSFTSTAPDGCLTLRLVTNASTVNTGWAANVTCSPAPPVHPFCEGNSSFENGTTAGWTCRYGSYNFALTLPYSGCLNPNGPNAPLTGNNNPWNGGNRHTIISDKMLLDPIAGVSGVAPGGGDYSFRLGNDGTGCGTSGTHPCPSQAESVRLDLLVTPQNAGFTYMFAAVINNPGHPAQDQPRFEVLVYDQNGAITTCGYHLFVAGSGLAQLKNAPGGWQYTDWTEVGLDLTAYIGSTVTIEFRTSSCFTAWPFIGHSAGPHSAYAYIDAWCKPMSVSEEVVCVIGSTVEICAPVGYSNYSWPAGQLGLTGPLDQRCVTVQNPVAGTVYNVNMELITGCPTSTNVTLMSPIPLSTTHTNVSCGGGGGGTATVTPNAGVPPYTYSWNTSPPQGTPTATGLFAGTYKATVVDSMGCQNTISATIEEVQPPTSPVCASGTMANSTTPLAGNPNDPNWGCLGGAPLLGSWYAITAVGGGSLGFSLVPEGPPNNYDWAIWGPYPPGPGLINVCLPDGPPVRCEASTNTATFAATGSYNTGMGQHAFPQFDTPATPYSQAGPGCGAQCGWTPGIQVQPGESYLLYVDNRAQNGNVFDLTWSLGGATIVCSPLPVDLLHLRARPGRDQVRLEWTTVSERASHRFLVERAGADLRFAPIGAVAAAGWSQAPIAYEFTDTDPLSGINHYRLRKEDLDGTYTHTNTVNALFDRRGSITLWPNPATDRITVEPPRSDSGPFHVEVHDASGRLVRSMRQGSADGVRDISIPLDGLEAGSYLVRLSTMDGTLLDTGRFVKR